jgi:hypothetical protein
MWKKLSVFAAVLGLLAMSGIALGAEGDEVDEGDTVLNYGYDDQAGVLVWNATSNQGPYDCSLENGTLTVTYTNAPDGVILVDGVADSGTPVSFPARPDSEAAPESSVDYTGPEGECGLAAGFVAGPNGQINHGMFMKLVNSMFRSVFDGKGRGCINKHFAQSALGKDEQQVKVSDVDQDSTAEEITEGMIDFETVITDCFHGNADGEDKVTGQEKAAEKRSDKAGKKGPPAQGERGKSASAPGRNK